jgi:hypothetical protein
MFDKVLGGYDFLKKYFPELASHIDTLTADAKEKVIKQVEPELRKVVERQTRNVTDIKGSFLDRVNASDDSQDRLINREIVKAKNMGRASFLRDVEKAKGDYLYMEKSMPPLALSSSELVTAWDNGYCGAEAAFRAGKEKKEWVNTLFWTGVKVGIGIGMGVVLARWLSSGRGK